MRQNKCGGSKKDIELIKLQGGNDLVVPPRFAW